MLRVAGDLTSGIEVVLSWRLLVLRGERRRRLTFAAGAAAPAALAHEPAAQLPGHLPTAAATAPPAAAPPARDRSAVDRGATHGRLAKLERALALLRRAVERRTVRVTRLAGHVEFALHDVAETGRAFGFACALATLIDPAGQLELQPRWDTGDWLAADLALHARVQPLRTLLLLLAARRQLPVAAARDTAPGRGEGGSLAA